MEVEGYCHKCGKKFDAHWTNYPNQHEGLMNPYCLYCKSHDIHILTDESNDPPEDYEGTDEEDYDE
jgi:hypothetical protein